jgi:DNA primase
MKETVDVKHLIESLGFRIFRETVKELRGQCKIHGGDNKTSFRFNKETRTWICFSHNCQEECGNDVIGLIKGALGVGFVEAVDYLRSLVGDSGNYNLLEHERQKEKERFIKSRKSFIPNYFTVSEDKLNFYKSFESDYFLSQGFSKRTLNEFEIGSGYIDLKGTLRDVIPIRDENGVLVAYSLRRTDDVNETKYLLTKKFDKNAVLYNLHRAKNHLDKNPLIVVEGFKAVWKLHEYGINNVVALMGSKITDGQANLVYTYSSKGGVVLLLDGDVAGVKGTLYSYKLLKNKVNKIHPIIIIEKDKSPDELSKEKAFKYLNFCLEED